MSEVCSKKPLWYVTLPSHPAVIVQCHYYGGDNAAIQYEGTPEALIKSGIATAEMLSGTYTGRKRVDVAGHHFRLQRSFRTEGGGSPHLYCKVMFYKPLAFIDQMPGARQAIYASERWRDERAGRTPDSQSAASATADILARFARG
jgi:hypothetical protein